MVYENIMFDFWAILSSTLPTQKPLGFLELYDNCYNCLILHKVIISEPMSTYIIRITPLDCSNVCNFSQDAKWDFLFEVELKTFILSKNLALLLTGTSHLWIDDTHKCIYIGENEFCTLLIDLKRKGCLVRLNKSISY